MTDPGALLLELERVREVRGTLPLFDALVARDAGRVRAALAAWPRHPSRAAVVAWLADNGEDEPLSESPLAQLQRHGIDDLDSYLATRQTERAGLERQLTDARAERDLALKSANVYALVAAVLAIAAIGGWVVALGIPEPVTPELTPVEAQP